MASSEYKPKPPCVQEQDLRNKVAVVTGATKGIGRSIALNLASRGASILGTYSSPQSAHNFDTLHQTINNLYTNSTHPTPNLVGIAADLAIVGTVREITNTLTTSLGGKIDILVLNAACNARPKLGTASAEEISLSVTANLVWPINLVELLVKDNLFNPNARVVVISSDRVRDPAPGSSLYSATKAGLESLTRSWAIELPLTFPGTTVNAVSVGLTDTPLFRGYSAEAQDAVRKERLPKVKVVEGGRMGFAEDVADVVGWLVSEKSRWVTGSVVAANGGAAFIG